MMFVLTYIFVRSNSFQIQCHVHICIYVDHYPPSESRMMPGLNFNITVQSWPNLNPHTSHTAALKFQDIWCVSCMLTEKDRKEKLKNKDINSFNIISLCWIVAVFSSCVKSVEEQKISKLNHSESESHVHIHYGNKRHFRRNQLL